MYLTAQSGVDSVNLPMPFFFDSYLLQGSFLLLRAADKLQGDANPSVIRACETIVRAHEACVVTLNTEYQVGVRISEPILFLFFSGHNQGQLLNANMNFF